MNVIVVPDYEQMSLNAAAAVAAAIKAGPRIVLGLPTGNTPKGMYRELVRLHQAGELDFAGVVTFNLDEYWGLGPEHPMSFAYFMCTHLLAHVNVAPGNAHWPDAGVSGADPDAACRAYEDQIRAAGGLDLVVLGIGSNGHIGFNEPGTPFDSATHLVRLTEETRLANYRGYGFQDLRDVPEFGITMGIGTIMAARRVLLLASGREKAAAVARAVNGPVTEAVPASVLQRHPDVTLILDEAAAFALSAPPA
ncbi:MAG TPA: glucosamine-6-phosphate deaminase [Limnochordales bacterium]